MMENYREELLELADAYCTANGKTRAQIANQLVKDARFFDRIEDGKGCTVDTFLKVKSWLEAHIPSPPGTNGKHRSMKAP